MAVTESKLKDGLLTLGTTPGTEFGCQVTNARINTSYATDGDAVETLCGDQIPAGQKLDTRSLAGTVIQDFDDPEGFISYTWDNELGNGAVHFHPQHHGFALAVGFGANHGAARIIRRRRQHSGYERLREVDRGRRHPHPSHRRAAVGAPKALKAGSEGGSDRRRVTSSVHGEGLGRLSSTL